MTTFRAETFQNEYLPIGGTDIDAIITVTSEGGADVGAAATRAEGTAVVIIIDVSGSMSQPRSKIRAARKAAMAAVESLRDGVAFGIVAGSHEARVIYPPAGLCLANSTTRTAAKQALQFVSASGGTAISTWLMAARYMFRSHDGWIRQVILLTDGRNQDDPQRIDSAIRSCVGVFRCDCRGVGTDWSVDQLRAIASPLLGAVDIVAHPKELEADFEAMIAHAMDRQVADVKLRVSVPPGTERRFVKQVAPTIEDLTSLGIAVDSNTIDYPLGAWGSEERDYHVGLAVVARGVDDKLMAARVSLVVGGEPMAETRIRATWTDDAATSTVINQRVAHFTGQQELASAIAVGLAARAAGDEAKALDQLGRAAQLASGSGHDGTLQLLRRVVHIEDAATGTVQLKRNVDVADEMALDTRSTKTVRVRPSGE